MKRTFSIFICLILIISLTSCVPKKTDGAVGKRNCIIQDGAEKVVFIDALGKEQTVHKNPKRVVCLYHSYLELWDLAGGEVIGRVDSGRPIPEKAQSAQVVGGNGPPNVERILSLKPDLIILSPTMNGQTDIIKVLEENNIEYIGLKYENFDEYLDALYLFTRLTGKDELYEKYGIAIEKEINEIKARVPKEKKPKVLLLFATARGVKANLPTSTVGSMFEDLGAYNIAYDPNMSDAQMQIFSMEKVLQEDPDFIFVQTMGSNVVGIREKIKKDVESNPAWASLKAVKNDKYIFLDKELYLYKANECYKEAYEGLAEILYPEVFNKK